MPTCCPTSSGVESWQDGESEFRGAGGHIGVQWAKTQDPIFTAWIEAARMTGLPVTDDYNGNQADGFRPQPVFHPQRQALLGRGRLPASGDEAGQSRPSRCARMRRAC